MRENEVEVHLGGTKRLLRYTTRSLFFIEKATGASANAFLGAVHAQDKEQDPYAPIQTLVLLIQAGMQHLPKQPTEAQVCDWIDLLAPKIIPESEEEETRLSVQSKALIALVNGLPGQPNVMRLAAERAAKEAAEKAAKEAAEKAGEAADPTTPAP